MDNINVAFATADEIRKLMEERTELTVILERLLPEIIEAAKRGNRKVVHPYHIDRNDVEYARKLGQSVENFLMNKGYKTMVQYDAIGFSVSVEW